MNFINIIFNRRINIEMLPVNFFIIILTACAVSIKQISSLKIDTMDTFENEIELKDPSWPFYSSGILKSHSGAFYTTGRNKTLTLSAPMGYSIFAAVRLLDLRPNNEDTLTLFANGTRGPVTYSNAYSYQRSQIDLLEEEKTFYAPDGQLGVTFYAGSIDYPVWGYDGFEILYTVQANWTKCSLDDFRCRNRRCVSKSFKCDGHNHCGDRSDQTNCLFPDPIPTSNGRVAALIAGISFSLIVIVCAIYISIRRALRNKIQRRIVIERPSQASVQGYPPPYSEHGSFYPPPPPYSPYNQGITNPGYQ